MSSTFRRRTASSKQQRLLAGTKTWTAGTTLVSTGLRELDAMIGAGQPLQTCIFLDGDRFTTIAETILRYWCAEALVHDQSLLIPIQDEEDGVEAFGEAALPTAETVRHFLDLLPRSLHLSQVKKQEQEQTTTETTRLLDTLVEEELEDEADQGLVVAWQYRSDVQQERLGLSNESVTCKATRHDNTFCHSFDLSTRLATQMDVQGKVTTCSITSVGLALQFARTILLKIKELHSQRTNHIIRVLIVDVQLEILAKALPIVLSHIRSDNLPVAMMVKNSSATEASLKWKRIVQRAADVALEAESFVSRSIYPPPPEFREFMGLLKVHKASTVTLAATLGHFADLTRQRRPVANVYGVKRDSRKLHLSLLHIPPEDYAAEGGSVGKGAERSGAGKVKAQPSMGCATSGGGMVIPDF